MNDKNLIRVLLEIQKSAFQIQQATMVLLEELQKSNISECLPDNVGENHAVDNGIIQSLPEKLYNLLPKERDEAMTINEIEKRLSDVPFSSIQNPLCELLVKGLILREMREDEVDKRKNAWEYWKISKEEPIFDAKRQRFNPYAIIYYLPNEKEDALSVLEIAQKLDIPKSTARDALKKLKDENLIQWCESVNEKNQKTEKYYRHFTS